MAFKCKKVPAEQKLKVPVELKLKVQVELKLKVKAVMKVELFASCLATRHCGTKRQQL